MLARSLLITLSLSAGAFADVVREGTGPRREALNAMELAPFDAGLWGKLTNWTGSGPLDGAKTTGNVVLICTWSSWYPNSVRQGLSIAQKAAERFADKGLIVVGVHHQEGWAEAADAAGPAKDKVILAHDASNAFRNALRVDQDPDFYIIDRAGHLRYADVASASVDAAVAELVAETREQAADLPKLLQERGEKARAEAARNQTIRTNIELNTLPDVPPGYEQPEPEVYERARWPEMTREEAQSFGMVDFQGRRQNIQLNFAPEAWHPREPATEGRAYVIYLWHPDISQSYSVLDRMDRLQSEHVRDLVVIGALTPITNLDPQRNQGQQGEGETPEELERKLRGFLRARNYSHTLAADFAATAFLSFAGANSGGRTFPIPGAMVVSSDGIIRWVGTTYGNRFESVIESVLLNDPGVKARRQADRQYIENSKK